jgi:SAM-dependent methyltransferase
LPSALLDGKEKVMTSEQSAKWNGPAARNWIEAQDALDRLLKPMEDLLVEAVVARSARAVLDVGCGTGGVAVTLARKLGAGARCVGLDISEPMIAAARVRAERERVAATFIAADAQKHAFEPASFDTIISRFGVMFFDDFIEAFANLRRAAASHAELRFISWRSAEENPFMTTAERAAVPLLPDLPVRVPDSPGQFGLASQARIRDILERSLWKRIEIRPIDVVCTMPEKELNGYLSRMGFVGMALQEADENTRAEVMKLVRPAFDPYVHGTEVRFTAACWMVSAGV